MGGRRILAVAVLVAACILGLSSWTSVQAMRFVGGERVVIGPDEVVSDDLYVAAREVIIHGTVQGDVYAAAQQVTVGGNGRVVGDLVVAAQIVDVQGAVEDDIRATGYVVRVAAPQVGDDVVAAAFSVEVGQESTVKGSLVAGAYQVLIAGDVAEDVLVGANGITVEGHVGGNFTAVVGERGGTSPTFWSFFFNTQEIAVPTVPSGLRLADGARVAGNLIYQSVQEATIAPGAQVGGNVEHRLPPPPAEETKPPAFGTLPWALQQLRRLVTYLLVGLLLFLTIPEATRRLGRTMFRRPLSALGWGIVAVAVVIAALVVVLLVAGIATGLFALLTLGTLARWSIVLGVALDALIVVVYLAYVGLVVPVLVPYATLSPLDRGGWWWVPPLVLGVVLYVILTTLPYVGWAIALLAILAGLGGAILGYRQRSELLG